MNYKRQLLMVAISLIVASVGIQLWFWIGPKIGVDPVKVVLILIWAGAVLATQDLTILRYRLKGEIGLPLEPTAKENEDMVQGLMKRDQK